MEELALADLESRTQSLLTNYLNLLQENCTLKQKQLELLQEQAKLNSKNQHAAEQVTDLLNRLKTIEGQI